MTLKKEPDTKSEKRIEKMRAPRGTDMAKLVTLIVTKAVRGQGTPDDPSRFVFQYWDLEGNMVAEYDPKIEKE